MSDALQLLAAARPGHAMRPFWMLEPHMHFLNHGSFGATPRHVLAAQDDWRARLERQPIRFVGTELPLALRAAAARLAQFLGTTDERLAFVENATDAVNAVLRSQAWQPGDEIVMANHTYPAVRHTVRFIAARHGVQIREAVIPFPLNSQQAIMDAYSAAITDTTRLVIVDHLFSSLALIAPVAEIVAHCKSRGVPVLVDGAHVPGMLPLNLDQLGADWYAGNCHKWLFAPKGCAFLYASPAGNADLHPTVISNFYGSGFPHEFDWQGTRDYSAWLAVTAALDFLDAFGVERYQRHLSEQASAAAHLLSERWQVDRPAPSSACGAMVTLPFPVAFDPNRGSLDDAAKYWHDRLWREHRVEVPVLAFNNQLWVRISAQMYNEISDYEALAEVLPN